MPQYIPYKRTLISLMAGLLLVACSEGQATSAAVTAGQGPQVDVATVVSQQVTEWDEFTGRLQAPEAVVLKPRVSGYLQQVHFSAGALVKQGDLLFSIDNSQFAAEVARLKAQLQQASSAAQLAQNDYKRALVLDKQKAIAQELLDSRRAKQDQSRAEVAAVQATLHKAELDLSYSEVRAPISGRISNAFITAGNFVHAGQSEMTRIVSTEQMYAWFNADEQSLLKYMALNQQGTAINTRESQSPVQLALGSQSEFTLLGQLDFIDNQLDANTGTIRARARFDNTDGQLLPGLFVRLRLAGSANYQGILIDEKAVGTDLSNKFVLVVDENSQLQYRPVVLGEKVGPLRIVSKGLQANERIVVNGLQRVRPQMPITANPVPMLAEDKLAELRTAQQAIASPTTSALALTPATAAVNQSVSAK